jgi:hypothetical protein
LSISAITNFYIFAKVFYFLLTTDLSIASVANLRIFANVFFVDM